MPKIEMMCNHCNKAIKWYKNFIHETDFIEIDEKYYCNQCLRLLAKTLIMEV